MKVIYTGKKPNPVWVGPWECSVCHTVVELESPEELKAKVDGTKKVTHWITCPLCEQEQVVTRHVTTEETTPND
jgi:rubredoxin